MNGGGDDGSSYQKQVLFALVTAVIIQFVFNKDKMTLWNADFNSLSTADKKKLSDAFTNTLGGWFSIFFVLLAAAYFDTTAPLAAMFAWLLLVAVLLNNADNILGIKSSTAK